MSLRWRLLTSLTAMAALIVGLAVYLGYQTLRRQWFSFDAGTAESYAAAKERFAWFEQGADSRQRVPELVAHWGTGNARFDVYLARYLHDGQSSEALRQAFSLELAWREELLPRWAHYWCYRAPLEPDREIASAVDYFALLAGAEPPREITWREVLDLQAVFELTGQGRLGVRLSPENWRQRFVRWQESRPRSLAHVARPAAPLPGWQGPLPE
jgi:hypothetical protein